MKTGRAAGAGTVADGGKDGATDRGVIASTSVTASVSVASEMTDLEGETRTDDGPFDRLSDGTWARRVGFKSAAQEAGLAFGAGAGAGVGAAASSLGVASSTLAGASVDGFSTRGDRRTIAGISSTVISPKTKDVSMIRAGVSLPVPIETRYLPIFGDTFFSFFSSTGSSSRWTVWTGDICGGRVRRVLTLKVTPAAESCEDRPREI